MSSSIIYSDELLSDALLFVNMEDIALNATGDNVKQCAVELLSDARVVDSGDSGLEFFFNGNS